MKVLVLVNHHNSGLNRRFAEIRWKDLRFQGIMKVLVLVNLGMNHPFVEIPMKDFSRIHLAFLALKVLASVANHPFVRMKVASRIHLRAFLALKVLVLLLFSRRFHHVMNCLFLLRDFRATMRVLVLEISVNSNRLAMKEAFAEDRMKIFRTGIATEG